MSRIDTEYWIDRRGKLHKYTGDTKHTASLHAEIAAQLYPDVKHAQDFLMKLGWVKVGSVVYGGAMIHKNPSQSQINTLYDLELLDNLRILISSEYVKWKG